MSTPPPNPDEIKRLKKLLLRKGAEINQKLTDLMAGKQVSIPMFDGKAGATPIEKLKRFMKLVDDALQRVTKGTYGSCETCGDGIPYVHLEQIPWIDTCQACAAKVVEEGQR